LASLMELRRRLNTIQGLSRISRGLRIINSYYMAGCAGFEQMEAYDEALLDSVGAILGLLPSEVIQSSRFINAPSLAPRVVLAFFSDGGFVVTTTSL